MESVKTDQVTDQVEKLLKALENSRLSTKINNGKTRINYRPTFRKNYLLPAIKNGIIEMTIPDKPRSSKQKYKRKYKNTDII